MLPLTSAWMCFRRKVSSSHLLILAPLYPMVKINPKAFSPSGVQDIGTCVIQQRLFFYVQQMVCALDGFIKKNISEMANWYFFWEDLLFGQKKKKSPTNFLSFKNSKTPPLKIKLWANSKGEFLETLEAFYEYEGVRRDYRARPANNRHRTLQVQHGITALQYSRVSAIIWETNREAGNCSSVASFMRNQYCLLSLVCSKKTIEQINGGIPRWQVALIRMR